MHSTAFTSKKNECSFMLVHLSIVRHDEDKKIKNKSTTSLGTIQLTKLIVVSKNKKKKEQLHIAFPFVTTHTHHTIKPKTKRSSPSNSKTPRNTSKSQAQDLLQLPHCTALPFNWYHF